jgi:hypothetical protein
LFCLFSLHHTFFLPPLYHMFSLFFLFSWHTNSFFCYVSFLL